MLAPLTSQQGRDLLEIVDDRHGCRSTIVTSQLPVDHWHEVIVDPTIAILRWTEKRLGPFPSTPERAPAPASAEPPSGLRPSSFVMCNTPVEVQFITSAGCLNYPCRTPALHRLGYCLLYTSP